MYTVNYSEALVVMQTYRFFLAERHVTLKQDKIMTYVNTTFNVKLMRITIIGTIPCHL